MYRVSRRTTLHCLLAGALCSLSAEPARASLARGLSLEQLVRACSASVIAVPLASECHFVEAAGRRDIVTDTRVRIEEVLTRTGAASREVMVRTLGGVVGRLGERVEGQAALAFGETCILFLSSSTLGVDFVTGMAQGHYPLRSDSAGTLRLSASRNLPRLLRASRSAVARLSGSELSTARALIHGSLP